MIRVTRRIYERFPNGRVRLLYAPGMTLSYAQADAAGLRADEFVETDPSPLYPYVPRTAAVETPVKLLTVMTVAELRAICESQGIDPDGANTRAEYVAVIESHTDQRNEVER